MERKNILIIGAGKAGRLLARDNPEHVSPLFSKCN
jgi:hypothetical protein